MIGGPHVFILGAGFSKAIDTYMPDTDTLGQDAIEKAGLTGNSHVPATPFGGAFSFEAWLSLIADEQPHLSETENLENAVIFSKMKNSIHDILSTIENVAITRPMPRWLEQLVTLMHFERAVVVTFNYDTFVEVAFDTLKFRGQTTDTHLISRDIINDQPPLPPAHELYRGLANRSFRLLKLHGSLNWWAVPNDTSGTSLAREPARSIFEAPQSYLEVERRSDLPGREPFIIPPTTAKSRYYKYPMIRELWKTSYQALRAADRITLFGYSMPPADSGMLGLLESSLRGRDVRIDIVNPVPDPIRDRLHNFGHRNIHVFDTLKCAELFTNEILSERSRRVVQTLAKNDPAKCADDPLITLSSDQRTRNEGSPIGRLERTAVGDLVLIPTGPNKLMPSATAILTDSLGTPIPDTYIRYYALIEEAKSGGRLLVRRDGVDEIVIAIDIMTTLTGVSANWIMFDSVPV